MNTGASFAMWVRSRNAIAWCCHFPKYIWKLLWIILIHPKIAMPYLLLYICKSVYMKTLFSHSFESKLSMMGLNLVLPAVLYAYYLGT